MRTTATAEKTATVSERLGPIVAGVPHHIGNGFTANHFSADMFGERMDPLLMVDHFVMTEPTFAPHMHAGISAVTAMFEDSKGPFLNRDTLGHDIGLKAGDLYWLAAASGAAHEEKPEQGAWTHALQIFVDLPAHLKTEPARSLYVEAEGVPVIVGHGHRVRVVLGHSAAAAGATGTPEEMTMLDGYLEHGGRFAHRLPADRQAWIYAVAGEITVGVQDEERTLRVGSATTVGAGPETDVMLESDGPAHFVLMAARPIKLDRGPLDRAPK